MSRQAIERDKSAIGSEDEERALNDNLSSRRILETVDVLLCGDSPALIYTCTRRVTLCHSPLGDANAPPRATANKQTTAPAILSKRKKCPSYMLSPRLIDTNKQNKEKR